MEGDKNGKRNFLREKNIRDKQLRQTDESVFQVINKTADWSGGEINISPDNIEVKIRGDFCSNLDYDAISRVALLYSRLFYF